MKKILFISLFLISSLFQGCNTVEGLGKDIQKGGEAITKTAKKV